MSKNDFLNERSFGKESSMGSNPIPRTTMAKLEGGLSG